jgi:molybdenum cofactor guanylyltransferase
MLYASVLAGGLSSRMGQDKSALLLQGKSLLDHALHLLQQLEPDLILVSGKPEHPLGIPDLLSPCGPPGALISIMEHLDSRKALDGSPLLLIPVDMPLLQLETLRAVLEAGKDVAACHFEGEVFPCVIKASPLLLAHLRDLLTDASQQPIQKGSERSMKGILRWLQARSLPIPHAYAGQFRNVNTPKEWQALSN